MLDEMRDGIDRRTQFAADRTVFAAERTYAAWVRTGLAALASGIGAKAVLTTAIANWAVHATATILILFSVFCFGAVIWRELAPGPPPPKPDARLISPWMLIAINSLLSLVALAALWGSWFGLLGSK